MVAIAGPKLTPDVERTITAYIRAGAFPVDAAAAAGVPAAVFDDWLRRGERKKAAKHYRTLHLAVLQADAQARVAAAIKVFEEKPDLWLTKGPGRETKTRPGWTGVVKPLLQVNNRSINLLADPTASAVLTMLLNALAPFPEARKAAVAALNRSADPPALPAPAAAAAAEVIDAPGRDAPDRARGGGRLDDPSVELG